MILQGSLSINVINRLENVIMLFILFLLTSTQTLERCEYNEVYDEKMLFIQSGAIGLTIYQAHSDYHIYVMEGKNFSIYSTPIKHDFHLTYENGFKVNSQQIDFVNGTGTVTLTPLLRKFLRPTYNTSIKEQIEPIQFCLDFSTERLSLKIVVGLLSFLIVITNVKNTQQIYEKVKGNLPESLEFRRFSRSRSPIRRSKIPDSESKEETSV